MLRFVFYIPLEGDGGAAATIKNGTVDSQRSGLLPVGQLHAIKKTGTGEDNKGTIRTMYPKEVSNSVSTATERAMGTTPSSKFSKPCSIRKPS